MSSIASPVTGAGSSSQTGSSNTSSTTPSSTDSLASESTFLKLLVAQIQNQDPTNPTDATQFVGQLTQYSELEQLININTNVQKIAPAASSTTTSTSTGSGTTGTPATNSGT